MKTFKTMLVLVVFLFVNKETIAQVFYGKITYERKTNLFKKFKDDNVNDWIKKEDKNKIDVFEMYFNDSISVFQPQESDLKESYSWATSKSKVYKNFTTGIQLSIKSIWGEKVYVEDSIPQRKWKITDSKRTIAGYSCRKVIWYKNDSTPIFAWYADAILPPVGPESFGNLPGAILGLATEDGGVIYFAKSIDLSQPRMTDVIPKKGKNKIYTNTELKTKLEKEFGKNSWGKAMIKDVFSW